MKAIPPDFSSCKKISLHLVHNDNFFETGLVFCLFF